MTRPRRPIEVPRDPDLGEHGAKPKPHPNNRQRGDYFERQTAGALRALDWVVVRSAGSLGPADLIAIKARHAPVLIACKVSRRIDPVERRALIDAAEAGGARPLLACRARVGWIDIYRVHIDGIGERVQQVPTAPSRRRRIKP